MRKQFLGNVRRQFQGSKKKARKKEFLERKAKKDAWDKRRQIPSEAFEGKTIEESAAILGLPLR